MIITHAKKPTDKKAYKYLSLFSGIEAASVAWKDFGWSCVGVSEIEPFPCEVLKNRFPNVPNLGDITKITEEQLNDLKHRHGGIDIVVGGSPCQSFSLAGKRLGLKDPRGNLMFEYCRVVRAVLPKYFIWENVIGALSSNGGKDFSSLIGEMVDIGYSLCWRVLDAQHFGVPQRRRRVFLVGSLGENNRAFDILFEQESRTRDLIPCRKTRENNPHQVEESIGNDSEGQSNLTGSSSPKEGLPQPVTVANYYEHHPQDSRVKGPKNIGNSVTARYGTGGGNVPLILEHRSYNITFNDANGRRKDRPHGGCYINETNISNTITTGGVGDTRIVEHAQWRISAWGSNVMKSSNPHTGFKVADISCTLDTFSPNPSKGQGGICVLENKKTEESSVRQLTPLECERLQGFPDNWTQIPYKGNKAKDTSKSLRYKALGNSMAVPVMRFIGLGIMGQ